MLHYTIFGAKKQGKTGNFVGNSWIRQSWQRNRVITGSGLLPLRGRAPEKAHVIPIKGGVIRKAATGTDRGGTLPLRKHFSGHHEAFFTDVLFDRFNVVSARDNLMVHYISVGQGDAIAINLPDGKVMLIDTGTEGFNTTYTKYLNEKVLNASFDKVIDYLVLTHGDLDHTGGALKLLQNFDVDHIYMPVVDGNSKKYKELKDYIVENDYSTQVIESGIVISTDSYSIDFYGVSGYTNTNDNCPVIKLEYMDYSFLFTGDIPSEVELDFVDKYGDLLDADVLKVAHHGSKYSSCEEFVEIVSPMYSVISCGDNNYGHPTSEAITVLENANSTILRTDTDGHILFAVGGSYDLGVICGEYIVSGFIFDYRILVLVIDSVLIFDIVIILLKKDKKKKNKT